MMIPSFSRILNNLQSIRYGWASVSVLNKEFSIEPARKTQQKDVNSNKVSSSINFNDTITLQDVSYSYEVDLQGVFDQILVIKKGKPLVSTRVVRARVLWQM